MYILFLSKHVWIFAFILICFATDSTAADSKFQTLESLEPDIWASVWLVDRITDGSATILVETDPSPRIGFVSFGFRGADIFDPKGSNYMALIDQLNVNDPTLVSLGKLVSNVENLGWQSKNDDSVTEFEAQFRRMQESHGRYWVPVGCYKLFFDQYYKKLSGVSDGKELNSYSSDCESEKPLSKISRPSIPMVPIAQVLREMSSNKKVIFVDTREPSEFAEKHIPGAINIPFRDIASSDLVSLHDADLVVPYCIKDFRGFEAARRLKEHGVDKVSLLDPFGLAGWLKNGLPVAGDEALSEELASEKLQVCLQSECLAGGKNTL